MCFKPPVQFFPPLHVLQGCTVCSRGWRQQASAPLEKLFQHFVGVQLPTPSVTQPTCNLALSLQVFFPSLPPLQDFFLFFSATYDGGPWRSFFHFLLPRLGQVMKDLSL